MCIDLVHCCKKRPLSLKKRSIQAMANYFNSKHCFPNYNKTTYTLKWPTLSECDVGDGESLWVVFVEKWSQYCEWAVNDQCIRGLGIESIHWLRCGGCPFTYLPSHPCPISVNLVQKIKCVPIFKVTLPYSWLPHIDVFFLLLLGVLIVNKTKITLFLQLTSKKLLHKRCFLCTSVH